MDDTYICPRCNGELETYSKDYRYTSRLPYPYDVTDFLCVIQCKHCVYTCAQRFVDGGYTKGDLPAIAKKITYDEFCNRVMKRPMRRYKPIVQEVEAVQWTGRNCEEVQKLLGKARWADTLEVLKVGSYVVRLGSGKFSILPEKDFKERYEEVLK